MKKIVFYISGAVFLGLSLLVVSNVIDNNIQEEIRKIEQKKSKDLVLKSFKTQSENTDYSYLNTQRPDFVEIAKNSINTVVHVKSSSSSSDYSIEDFIF